MSRTPFAIAPIVLLIVVGLLLGGGLAIHQIGWWEGYQAAHLADGAAASPPMSYGFGGWGLFVSLGVAFLLILIVGRLLRAWAWTSAWRQWCGPDAPAAMGGECFFGPWAGHHHRHHPHPPVPPWCAGWHRPHTAETTATDAGSGGTASRPEDQTA